jgi:putative membrane protein
MTWIPYCGAGPDPAELWSRWNLDPLLLAALAFAAASLVLLARRATPWRPALGWTALAVLTLAFVSPLCALSSALFAARTVHHLLLVAVAAPLIAWSAPLLRARAAPLALACHAALFWAWHAPAAYGLALQNDAVYWLMQASLLASATWFWRAVRAAAAPTAVGLLLVATIQMGLLGAILTFAPQPLYAPHALTTFAWGLTPLEDQQTAGLIMWAPASALYLIAALVVLGRWLSRPAEAAA